MSGRTWGRPGVREARAVSIAVSLALALVVAACGSGPGATGSGSAGASPTPAASVDGAALAASFVDILGDPELHADVVQQATSTADQAGEPLDFRVTMSGVLALPDVDLELVVEAEGQSTRFRIVVAGDQSFADLGEGWVAAPPGSVDTSELTSALVVVSDPDDLEYVGTQEVDGRTLYHLVATRPLPYMPAGFEGTGTGTGTMDDLDAYVEADGTPVRIQLSFTASGTTDAGALTVNGTTEIRFSDVGGDQVVVAPSIAPSLAPSAAPSLPG
jgi:hypothetical protein